MKRTLTKRQITALSDRCYKLYEKGGAAAVYNYTNDHPELVLHWRFCEPCDAYVPVVFTNKGKEEEHADCLVCGSTIDLRTRVTLVNWDDVRRDMQHPESDQNAGFIHGLNILQEQSDEVLEVIWYTYPEQRAADIAKYNYKIINE